MRGPIIQFQTKLPHSHTSHTGIFGRAGDAPRMREHRLGTSRECTPSWCSDSQSPSVSLTPELDGSNLTQSDEQSRRCTPAPARCSAALPGGDWDTLVQDLHMLYPHQDPDSIAAAASDGTAEKRDFQLQADVPTSDWISSFTDTPALLTHVNDTQSMKRTAADDSSSAMLELCQPAKRQRVRPIGARPILASGYQVPALLPMNPRAISNDMKKPAAVRAWLLERRALLQKAHDDVYKDMTGLKSDQAHYAELRKLLSDRICTLRKRRGQTISDVPFEQTNNHVDGIGVGMDVVDDIGSVGVDVNELDNGIWNASNVSSVADLLEKNILCL